MKYTTEAVSYLHPDKICDQISDAIVDACIEQDPHSRVAVETMGGHGHIILAGEVTTKADLHFEDVAWKAYKKLIGKKANGMIITSHISAQSPDIAKGVDNGGAGDQGIMVGYACDDTKERMPFELMEARKILKPFNVDAKSQVTVEREMDEYGNCPIPKGKNITDIVLSVQGKTQKQLQTYLKKLYPQKRVKFYCNNTGSFEIGGFDADSGVTGRKIVQDQYGAQVPTGGGAFSGKDPTKVDRSGAYMARYMALLIQKQTDYHYVTVKIAYVIGNPAPVMVTASVRPHYGEPLYEYPEQKINALMIDNGIDLRVDGIIERFNLRRPIYQDLARNGHFGRPQLPWENLKA
jgi:S-adenosylmethionine synthetase